MTIKLVGKNTLSFDDDSKLEIPDLWVRALRDKLANEKLTLQDFLSKFDSWLHECWKTKTASDTFSFALGVSRWEDSIGLKEGRPYTNMGELAENELYYYLRGYLLGLVLHQMSGGKKGAILITDKGIIEYPSNKRKGRPRKRV